MTVRATLEQFPQEAPAKVPLALPRKGTRSAGKARSGPRSKSAASGFPGPMDRRRFLASSGLLAFTIAKPQWVWASQAASTIKLGLIGCGGRGNWIADLFRQHGGYQFIAVADYFPDRALNTGKRLGLPEDKCFSTLSGYKRLLDAKPDAVVIESPPYFHPDQTWDAVEAGCHAFVAKPIAVDVPGCQRFLQAGQRATQKKLCVLVDFQTRANPLYQECVQRVRQGDIGPIVSAEAVYYTGSTWGGPVELKDPETRMRLWGRDRILSGDIITEQNIHALDVATWFLDRDPIRAYGACTRRGRQDPPAASDLVCHDAFSCVFVFPDDIPLSFSSKQYGTGLDDIGCWVFGPKGTAETHYFGQVLIRGEKSYKGGKLGNLYTEGAVANIAAFHQAITQGNFQNPTVAPSVRSNLTTILGRTAAYKKAEVSWDQMLQTAEKLEFPLDQLKS